MFLCFVIAPCDSQYLTKCLVRLQAFLITRLGQFLRRTYGCLQRPLKVGDGCLIGILALCLAARDQRVGQRLLPGLTLEKVMGQKTGPLGNRLPALDGYKSAYVAVYLASPGVRQASATLT